MTKYKIGNKTIDLNKLVAVGELYSKYSGALVLPLAFNFNSNEVVEFLDGKNGLPEYLNNNGGDYTDEDSDFYREAQKRVNELIETWEKLK